MKTEAITPEQAKANAVAGLRSLLDAVEQSTYANGGERIWGLVGGSSLCKCSELAASIAALGFLETPQREIRDSEIALWMVRHGLDMSLSSARAAFEDAQTLHRTAP